MGVKIAISDKVAEIQLSVYCAVLSVLKTIYNLCSPFRAVVREYFFFNGFWTLFR